MRQSTAQSHHQLLPACGARGACKWRTRAGRGRWCSGCGLRSSGAQGPRHRDADTSKWRRAESDMQSLRRLQEPAASTLDRFRSTRPLHPLTSSSAWLVSHGKESKWSRSSLPRPTGMCQGREYGNRQPSHVISAPACVRVGMLAPPLVSHCVEHQASKQSPHIRC